MGIGLAGLAVVGITCDNTKLAPYGVALEMSEAYNQQLAIKIKLAF